MGTKILSVSRSTSGDVLWDPISGQIEAEKLEGIDAVIHLAGENIASRRWTDKQKRRILDSRVEGTKLLTKSIVNLSNPPSVFFKWICDRDLWKSRRWRTRWGLVKRLGFLIWRRRSVGEINGGGWSGWRPCNSPSNRISFNPQRMEWWRKHFPSLN